MLPVTKGSQVEFPNDDTIYHNVFSLSKTKPFDLGIYAHGTSNTVTFERSGMVKVYCNLHPDMVGYILVLNNSFFSVTDKEGNFSIDNVPNGDYVLRIWYEFSDETKSKISLSGGKKHSITHAVKENKVLKRHKNKFGKPYKSKY